MDHLCLSLLIFFRYLPLCYQPIWIVISEVAFLATTEVYGNKLREKNAVIRSSGTKTINSHIPTSKSNGKEAHTQTDTRSRKIRTVNRMNSPFPNRWSFSNNYFILISILTYKLNKPATDGQLLLMLQSFSM